MHPARIFHENDPEVLAARVRESGLATVVGVADDRPLAAHAPVLLDEGQRLRFHLSAGNRLSPALAKAGHALVVVTGEDAYVSPDWYQEPDQVPTWNYVSVEMEGPVRVLDRDAATRLLDDLSARHEGRLAPKAPWTRSKLDPVKFEALLNGITAFEMTIERFTGITKLGQNKSPAMVRRVAEALAERDDAGSRVIAGAMLSHLPAG